MEMLIKQEVLWSILISFSLIIFIFLSLYVSQNFYMKDAKAILNNHYLKDFPKLQILTKVGEINGKIQDIFHENLMIIDDNGTNIAIDL